MNKLTVLMIVLSLSGINHVFARDDVIFMPMNNKPLVNSTKTTGLSYGLSDEEITRRVEMGMAETVPISALKKWQERKKLENIESPNTTSNDMHHKPAVQNIQKSVGDFIDANTYSMPHKPSQNIITDNKENNSFDNNINNIDIQYTQTYEAIDFDATEPIKIDTEIIHKNQ